MTVRRGERLAAIGGIALLVAPFLPWVGLGEVNLTAWSLLELGRYLLLVTGVLGSLVLVVGVLQRNAQSRFLMAARAAATGAVCSIYVIYRLVHPVDPGLDLRIGSVMGLGGALFVTAGGLRSMAASRHPGKLAPDERHE